MVKKIIIVPGNGMTVPVSECNWYGSVQKELKKMNHGSYFDVILKDMPDALCAREKYWIPFIRDELKCDEDTILIGHSSGAVAAMRFMEKYEVGGCILVSTYFSHLECEIEKKSGYFDREWQWDKIKQNTPWIIQFASEDDPLVPIEEQHQVAQYLKPVVDFRYYKNYGHFMEHSFPELVHAIKTKI